MRLKVIEVGKGRITVDREGAGPHRSFVEFKAAPGADNDPIEALVFPRGAAAGPGVGDGDIRSKTDGIRADAAPWLQHPFGFVRPKLRISQLECAAVLCFDAGRTRIAVPPITEQRELVFFEIETLERVFGLPRSEEPPHTMVSA